jgi:hypothetical protein
VIIEKLPCTHRNGIMRVYHRVLNIGLSSLNFSCYFSYSIHRYSSRSYISLASNFFVGTIAKYTVPVGVKASRPQCFTHRAGSSKHGGRCPHQERELAPSITDTVYTLKCVTISAPLHLIVFFLTCELTPPINTSSQSSVACVPGAGARRIGPNSR